MSATGPNSWPRYRVSGITVRSMFKGPGAYERALKRAREMRSMVKTSFTVLEIDANGYETPVAEVRFNPRKVSPAWTRAVGLPKNTLPRNQD